MSRWTGCALAVLVVYSIAASILWQRADARLSQARLDAEVVRQEGRTQGQQQVIVAIAQALQQPAQGDYLLTLQAQNERVLMVRADGTWESSLVTRAAVP